MRPPVGVGSVCCIYVADTYWGRPEPTTDRDRWQLAQMDIWTEAIELEHYRESEG